jgi:hypothetical protein
MGVFGPPALPRTTVGGWDFDCDGDQEMADAHERAV